MIAVIGPGLASLASWAVAQAPAPANLDKLMHLKVATTDLNIPVVAQTGANADAIKENLKQVKMPPGFKIALLFRCA